MFRPIVTTACCILVFLHGYDSMRNVHDRFVRGHVLSGGMFYVLSHPLCVRLIAYCGMYAVTV
jgi:hypothetical protein